MKFEQFLNESSKDDKNYLKAPNGKKSNLTEAQWLLVRTDTFKKWFGDWENDPKQSSKVLDENGEPLIVHHGTADKFDIFDKKKAGAGNDKGLRGKGFYFSPNERTSSSYGSVIIQCFLNIRNPFVPESFNTIDQIISKLNTEGHYEDDDFDHMFEFKDGDFRIYSSSSGNITSMMKDSGYDGVIYKKKQEVIAFEPVQIKSINNDGSFSKSSNNINEHNNEI